MEVVKRRNQFLVDIRRKNKREFYDSQRKSLQTTQSKPKPTLTPTDQSFIKLQKEFIELEDNDIERLITLSQIMRDYSQDNLNCAKQLTSEPFFDKLFDILVDLPQHINVIDCTESQTDLCDVFENLSMLVYNLMCEASYRKALGLEAAKQIEKILLQDFRVCPVDLDTLIKTLLVGVEEVSIWNWLVMDSEFICTVFDHKWSFEERLNLNKPNKFILERVQILIIGELTANLLDSWKNSGTADNSQIERFLRLFDQFLINLKGYFELIMGDSHGDSHPNMKNQRTNLSFWRENINPQIVKTLRSIFFAMESDSIFELSQLGLMLIHHDINVMLFGLPLIRVLEDSASLNYLNDILRITLQEEDSDFEGLAKSFAEIDLTGLLVAKIDSFNLHQQLHSIEFVNVILSHFLTQNVKGLDSIREKIPSALVEKVFTFLEGFFEPIGLQKIHFDFAENLATFLRLYVELVPEKLFQDFVDSRLNFLCVLCYKAFDLMDPVYLDAILELVHQILSRLYFSGQLTAEIIQYFDLLWGNLHKYVNQSLHDDMTGFNFDYKERTKQTIYEILVFLDNK